jgi:hypothetical protein
MLSKAEEVEFAINQKKILSHLLFHRLKAWKLMGAPRREYKKKYGKVNIKMIDFDEYKKLLTRQEELREKRDRR